MYSDAISLLREVLERKPRSFEANAAVGRYYYTTGSYEQAEIYLTRALELRPRISRIPYGYLGLARMEMGKLDSAEAVIRQGIQIEPVDRNEGFIHGALGTVLSRKGDWQGALAQFRSELANNPERGIRDEISKIEARLRRSDGNR